MKDSFRKRVYNFVVPIVDPSIQMALAIEFREYQTGTKIDASTVQQKTINHWLLNHLRHQVCNYDRNVWSPSFQKDPEEYLRWFGLINRAIAEKYPFLKRTAELQYARKRGAIYNARLAAMRKEQAPEEKIQSSQEMGNAAEAETET